MGKRFVQFFIPLMLALLLTSCSEKPADRITPPPPINDYTGQTIPPETQPETFPEETDVPDLPEQSLPDDPVAEESQTPVSEVPYLQQIERSDHSIYHGPGYDYGFVDTIKRGTYTIVEEEADPEGNLWGKLKSGIGWINLTEIQHTDSANSLISANYADDELVLHGTYHHYSTGREYRIPIVFRAYGKIHDVALFDIWFDADGYYPGEELFSLPEMTEELPLVAELDFPGDMTTYAIRFADEAGTVHTYTIYISGRNGALMLEKE